MGRRGGRRGARRFISGSISRAAPCAAARRRRRRRSCSRRSCTGPCELARLLSLGICGQRQLHGHSAGSAGSGFERLLRVRLARTPGETPATGQRADVHVQRFRIRRSHIRLGNRAVQHDDANRSKAAVARLAMFISRTVGCCPHPECPLPARPRRVACAGRQEARDLDPGRANIRDRPEAVNPRYPSPVGLRRVRARRSRLARDSPVAFDPRLRVAHSAGAGLRRRRRFANRTSPYCTWPSTAFDSATPNGAAASSTTSWKYAADTSNGQATGTSSVPAPDTR